MTNCYSGTGRAAHLSGSLWFKSGTFELSAGQLELNSTWYYAAVIGENLNV